MFKRKTYYEAKSELLEDLLEVAGEESHEPVPPVQGIPKRWIPGFLRISLKCLILPYVLIDQSMQKVARKIISPPFKKIGKCKKRGNCCYYVLIRHSNSLWGRLFFLWHTQVHGFYPRLKRPHIYEGHEMHVMGCRYLKEDGSCGQYRLRPQVCRQWPLIEHFGYPKILKGCGYTTSPPYPKEETQDAFTEDPRFKILS
jgi:Fe-S-cluster containining protein